MKVLYICTSPEIYGDNIAILNIIPFLEKNGVDPFFYVTTGCVMEKYTQELGYKILTGYNVSMPGRWPRPKPLLRYLYQLVNKKEYNRLLSAIKEISPDLIHTNLSTTALGWKLSKDLGIPHVWHIREYGDLDHGYKHFPTKSLLIKKVNSPNTTPVFITNDIFNHFQRPTRGEVVYDGAIKDETNIPEICEKDDSFFLYVGRLVPTKGIELLLRSYLKYTEKSRTILPLKIAGSGSVSYENRLRQICNSHSNGHYVDFFGYRNDVNILMSNARALIVPSMFEAFGFITAEAMYNGCPVIGHNTAGTKCQFDNGLAFTGKEIGYRYSSIQELIAHLETLSNINRKDIMPMLVNAQKTVCEYYMASKSAMRIFNIYKRILNK